MSGLAGKKPVATMELRQRDVNSGNHEKALAEFLKKIK
jgi:hypothetical protein